MGLRRYLSFANVISVIALFVALGGGAYAVQVAKKNSVTTKSIRNSTIRSADIGSGQIKSSDIGSGQVKASDIEAGLLSDATTGSTQSLFAVCTQDVTTYESCLDKQVTLDEPGRIYATADGTADSGAGSVPVGVNTCRLTLDGAAFTGDYVVAADFSPGESFSFGGVSEPVAAGSHLVQARVQGQRHAAGPADIPAEPDDDPARFGLIGRVRSRLPGQAAANR